jgi:hypothetical protein
MAAAWLAGTSRRIRCPGMRGTASRPAGMAAWVWRHGLGEFLWLGRRSSSSSVGATSGLSAAQGSERCEIGSMVWPEAKSNDGNVLG